MQACVEVVTAPSATMGEVLAVLDMADWTTVAHWPVATGVVEAAAVVGSALCEDENAGANGGRKRHGDTAHGMTWTALIAVMTSRLAWLPQAAGGRGHPGLGGWWPFTQPPSTRLPRGPSRRSSAQSAACAAAAEGGAARRPP